MSEEKNEIVETQQHNAPAENISETAAKAIFTMIPFPKKISKEDATYKMYEIMKHFKNNPALFNVPAVEVASVFKALMAWDNNLDFIGVNDIYLIPYRDTLKVQYTPHRLKAIIDSHQSISHSVVGSITESTVGNYVFSETSKGSIVETVTSIPIAGIVMDNGDKNKNIVGSYFNVFFTDGHTESVLVTQNELANARSASKNNGQNSVWEKYTRQMSEKVAIRRMYNKLQSLFDKSGFSRYKNMLEMEDSQYSNTKEVRETPKKITMILKENKINFKQEGKFYVVHNSDEIDADFMTRNNFIKQDDNSWKRGITRKAHDELKH